MDTSLAIGPRIRIGSLREPGYVFRLPRHLLDCGTSRVCFNTPKDPGISGRRRNLHGWSPPDWSQGKGKYLNPRRKVDHTFMWKGSWRMIENHNDQSNTEHAGDNAVARSALSGQSRSGNGNDAIPRFYDKHLAREEVFLLLLSL